MREILDPEPSAHERHIDMSNTVMSSNRISMRRPMGRAGIWNRSRARRGSMLYRRISRLGPRRRLHPGPDQGDRGGRRSRHDRRVERVSRGMVRPLEHDGAQSESDRRESLRVQPEGRGRSLCRLFLATLRRRTGARAAGRHRAEGRDAGASRKRPRRRRRRPRLSPASASP